MDQVLGIAKALIIAAFQKEPPVKPVVVNSRGDVILQPDEFEHLPAESAKSIVYGPTGSSEVRSHASER
ncbi:MAG: hypothetical protein U0704_02335 [Candidatus Eisenbacteria bacterium]